MDARELRIGNLVNTRRGTQKCIDVLCDCVNFHDLECEPYDLIDPIPLTEEWLEKFGFEFEKPKSKLSTAKWHIKNLDENNKIGVNLQVQLFSIGEGVDWIFPMKIEYLHQLQNLYFALTGIELEFE